MKDLKVTLMNIANIIIGILIYVFLSQPYIASKNVMAVGNTSGYDIIKNLFESNGGNGTEVMMALSTFFVSIFAGILIVASIYGLLENFNIIKESKFSKIANIINIVAASALVVFGIISLACTSAYISNTQGMSLIVKLGWAVIVNFVISILTLASSVFNFILTKKRA